MVNLTRIYTRTGDAGKTRLSDNSVASKTDLRVQAYGDVDEANSLLGVALATTEMPEDMRQALSLIQNELFDVGADLATPLVENPKWVPLRILPASVERLEAWCDQFNEKLPELRSFILPGGSPAGAYLNLARAVIRRAERTAWAAVAEHGTEMGCTAEQPNRVGGINTVAIQYLNRLSDLLFILSRVANLEVGDVLWRPGTDRENPNQK